MKFEIRLYEAFPKACFYTVHMSGEELCETDRFIQKFNNNVQFEEDLVIIRGIIRNMGKFGAPLERFRFENNAHALPQGRNNLRLYCVRCTGETVILAGGGQKTSQSVQKSPDAYPHFQLVRRVETLFSERVKEGEIKYNGKFLDGNLSFDTEL